MSSRHFSISFARIHTFKVGAVVWYKHQDKDYYLVFRSLTFPERGIQIPRGRMEKDESFQESVLREVFEETGLKCRIICPLTMVYFENSEDHYSNSQFYFIVRPNQSVDPTRRWLHRDLDESGQELEIYSVLASVKPDFLSRGQHEVIYSFQQWLKDHDPNKVDKEQKDPSEIEQKMEEEI